MQNDKSQKNGLEKKMLKPTKIGSCIQITVSNIRLFVLLLRKLLEKIYLSLFFKKMVARFLVSLQSNYLSHTIFLKIIKNADQGLICFTTFQ